jgi:(p)ppGpp synthase/HD superfamily hydrolase
MMTPESLILNAASYAARMHAGQNRKYSGEPYVVHCLEVADSVASVGGSAEMIAAAILHDVVEDTAATIANVEAMFGVTVAQYVGWMTDVSRAEDGNRAARKALDRDHIAAAPAEAKTIKLADLISNARSILPNDPGFGKVFLHEMALLLDVLGEGNAVLFGEAAVLVEAGLVRD